MEQIRQERIAQVLVSIKVLHRVLTKLIHRLSFGPILSLAVVYFRRGVNTGLRDSG